MKPHRTRRQLDSSKMCHFEAVSDDLNHFLALTKIDPPRYWLIKTSRGRIYKVNVTGFWRFPFRRDGRYAVAGDCGKERRKRRQRDKQQAELCVCGLVNAGRIRVCKALWARRCAVFPPMFFTDDTYTDDWSHTCWTHKHTPLTPAEPVTISSYMTSLDPAKALLV